jgi:hypothetical protein
VQIAGIELANIGEPLPVANRQFAVAEFHGAGSAQRLQRAIDGHQRHSLGVAKLSLMKRQVHRSRLAKARTARAVIQFAERMRLRVRGGRLLLLVTACRKNGGIDERFPPDRETHRRPLQE